MNKALFLDRDGVINVEKNYVYRVEDFEFVDGIFEVLKYFQNIEYLLIVITNQAGIGRGYYTEEDFHILNDWMLKQFKNRGIYISKVYYCPHHPDFGIGKYKMDCDCRKPKPGMIIQAQKDFDIDLSQSILVGDKESDIQTGINSNIGFNILIGCTNKSDSKADIIVKSNKDLLLNFGNIINI